MTPQLTAGQPGRHVGRIIVAAVLTLLVLLITFALLRASLFYSLYTSLLAKVTETTGLDLWASRALALTLVSVLWFLPWHLLLFPWIKNARGRVVTLLIATALGLCALQVLTRNVYFSRADGHPLRYYIQTLDGYKVAALAGTDPVYGIPYQPITPQVARDIILWQRRGWPSQEPLLPKGMYFSASTGEPLRWYAKLPDGRIEMFTLPGFHPTYGTKLLPATTEVVSAYEKQTAEAERQRQEATQRQARLEARRKAQEERNRQAREQARMKQPLQPGRYLTSPAPAGDVDGFHFTLTEIDLKSERLLVHVDVANANRTYAESLHQSSIRLGLVTADGASLAYAAIRAKEGALLKEGTSFSFPSFGQRGAFVMEFTQPELLDRTFSVVVNDQPLFSGLNLHSMEYHSY